MAEIKASRHDIVIVGGGAAGLRAAIAAAEADPSASIALVSKVYPMRSHTVSAEGGAAASAREDDSPELHGYDTVKGSDFLGDQDVIEYFVEEAPKELALLENWGCPWSREDDGTVSTRAFGGMTTKRTWFAADKVGFHMLHALFQHSMRFENIVRYDEYFVSKILMDGGEAKGVAAMNIRTGEYEAVLGRAVILATGGAGKVFPFTTNGTIKTGDGMALAYRAGVALKDMEFVQYHPTGLPGTGILITEATRGEGGYLRNCNDERFLVEYDYGVGQKAELGPRDMISRAIIQEFEAGRAFQSSFGEYCGLDLTHLGEAKIMERLPFVRELAKTYIGVDPVYEYIPIRPVVHYMMGGVDTDVTAATSIPGLYAAGEVACASLNGANRLGSNSLTECLVFGAAAGRNALDFSKNASAGDEAGLKAEAAAEAARVDGMRGAGTGHEQIAQLRREMTMTMETGCGVYRRQETMNATVEAMASIKSRLGDLKLSDKSKVFNTEIIAALELANMVEVAEALAVSAAHRKESRGAHTCRDFPTRDDQQYLYHTLCHRDEAGGRPRLGKKDVTLGHWEPEERKY
jgi:fumarate reductase flavoprotein subunit